MSEIPKNVLIDAIVGQGLPPAAHISKFEIAGLVRFSGNQWNPDWEWIRNALSKLSHEHLSAIYGGNYSLELK